MVAAGFAVGVFWAFLAFFGDFLGAVTAFLGATVAFLGAVVAFFDAIGALLGAGVGVTRAVVTDSIVNGGVGVGAMVG